MFALDYLVPKLTASHFDRGTQARSPLGNGNTVLNFISKHFRLCSINNSDEGLAMIDVFMHELTLVYFVKKMPKTDTLDALDNAMTTILTTNKL